MCVLLRSTPPFSVSWNFKIFKKIYSCMNILKNISKMMPPMQTVYWKMHIKPLINNNHIRCLMGIFSHASVDLLYLKYSMYWIHLYIIFHNTPGCFAQLKTSAAKSNKRKKNYIASFCWLLISFISSLPNLQLKISIYT